MAICANLMQLPGRPEIREANIRSIMALRAEATKYAMPLMIEPLVMQDNAAAGGGYMVDGDTDKIMTLVRQARELGADLIKADPTDNVADYHKVIEVAGDVLPVRGGGRVDDRTLLERTVRCSPRRSRHRVRPECGPARKPVRNHPGADGGAPRPGQRR